MPNASKLRARIPTSFSATSLDVAHLINVASTLPSLMSESVTLSSLSSASSDVPPLYGPRKPPAFRMVGLGDHLKLFSSAIDRSSNDTVITTSPTAPRLKSMLKECLSIDKWAENSAGWSAPGHIPWGREGDDKSQLPENPMTPTGCVPPDLGLKKVREHTAPNEESSTAPCVKSRPLDAYTSAYVPDKTGNDDLAEMMLELRSMRSYFQESLDSTPNQSCSSLELLLEKTPLPSLVISNSHFTFPLSLDSSLSLSRPRTIASRRGKACPPSLLLNNGIAQIIPYPDIPTAFLGSASLYGQKFGVEERESKPDLGLEDMITNLRLQCSTMALRTPVTDLDPSWNSRSFIEQDACKDAEGSEGAFIDTKVNNSPTKPQGDTLAAGHEDPLLCQGNFQEKTVIRSMGPESVAISCSTSSGTSSESMRRTLSTQSPSHPDPHQMSDSGCSRDVGSVSSTREVCSRPLRSAMAKHPASRPRKSLKCVRFILKQQDMESKERLVTKIATDVKESTKPGIRSTSKVVRDPLKVDVKKSASASVHISAASRSALPPQKPKPSIGIKRSPSTSPSQGKVKMAATANSPLRNSIAARPVTKAEIDQSKPIEGGDSLPSRRSVQSLGRQSLNRIMKTPIFGVKEGVPIVKRSTISSLSMVKEVKTDENAARREDTSESLRKKSRMPVPLRNILTRFK
ncbi:hypothetical protein D9613_006963 [Agrocybe pediades]|uniref:Uncharacterized protein n=1 Tax=Agrocybe pediades TaxID=84607 RepID=A0A8H4QGV7_9AGAR|nr:hypothetical protein D9613_006963 [Agrocybe pediades]